MNKNTTKILKILKETYPEAKTALKHENPLQLLVATILSAQCTDERVNKVKIGRASCRERVSRCV